MAKETSDAMPSHNNSGQFRQFSSLLQSNYREVQNQFEYVDNLVSGVKQ